MWLTAASKRDNEKNKNKVAIFSSESVQRCRRRRSSVKRAGSISGNIHQCACEAHSELCEGGAYVSKKATNLSHLADSLSAEASESIDGDSLDVAVLLQATTQT